MTELYHATIEDENVTCGSCGWLMRHPKVLLENGGVKLVECHHCYRLNKVKTK